MDMTRLPNLADYTQRRLAEGDLDAEERAKIENFVLDERPPNAGIDLYAGYLKTSPLADLDDWQSRHRSFVAEEINLDEKEAKRPWTFRPENMGNRLREIDPRIYLVRVENANWPCSLQGTTPETLRQQINNFQRGGTEDKATAYAFLKGVAKLWNAERDQRPLFATTLLEVQDIVEDDSPDWAERLRDRLGLGHYAPGPGCPVIDIVLMCYTVQEVLDSLEGGEGYPAIPTVLESDMSPYFFPSPIPNPETAENPYRGHTVNLALAEKENDYRMGVELLHPRIEYKPEHFFKMGVIAKPVDMPLERARTFHLPWIRLHSGRDDFGGNLFGDTP